MHSHLFIAFFRFCVFLGAMETQLLWFLQRASKITQNHQQLGPDLSATPSEQEVTRPPSNSLRPLLRHRPQTLDLPGNEKP